MRSTRKPATIAMSSGGRSSPSLNFRPEPCGGQTKSGDSVLFFTDGISDAFNTEGESFGLERLQRVCAAYPQSPPPELLGRVFAEVERFARGQAQHDDMAAAVFRCCEE